jgi:hypothetical protein
MRPVPARGKLPQIALRVSPTSLAVFRSVLSDRLIVGFLEKIGFEYRERVYTPLIVFWAMIAQCLDDDHSCALAVARVLEWLRSRKAPGQRRNRRVPEVSPDTGSFCRARARLPLELLIEMTRRVGHRLDKRIPQKFKMWGRDVYLVDGTTVSMPDESSLEKQFGKGGGGIKRAPHVFPLARIVVLISLSTGAVMDLAIGAYKAGEHALFRSIWSQAPWLRGSIIVGDSLYGSYANLAMLINAGVDIISRPFGRRNADLRQGKPLGPGDRLVTWKRNLKDWPLWLERGASLPDKLVLRLIEVQTLRRGHRPKRVILVTTLLDPERYPALDIANLYTRRWEIELDIRHLKTVLGIDVLRGKTPDIVRKEIWAFMATYNLIRTVMWEAGSSHDIPPYGLEFQRDAPTAQYLAAAHRACPLVALG